MPAQFDDLTVCITAFNRPECLEHLVESIRARYPTLPILVADNGWEPADLSGWSNVELIDVAWDCGLSACRNALAAACSTEFLVLAEEDFVFDDRTDLEPALRVIRQAPSMGMIGGSLETDRQMQHYARNFRREIVAEGEALRAVPAGGPMRTTSGVRWRGCDMVFNWGILRTEMAREIGWDEDLKLAEHVDFFYRLADTGWEVAHTPELIARHERQEPGEYRKWRQRAAEFLEVFRDKHDLCRFEHTAAAAEPLRSTRPVIVMGIGHSGTSILSRMLSAAGFYAGPADEEYAEHPGIRELNEETIRTGELDLAAGLDHLEEMASPFVIKDPRFVHTLDKWHAILGSWKPTLVWIVRNDEDVADSYRRRNENYRDGQTLESLYELARHQFDSWPWAKIQLDYENIATAVGLFDLDRAGASRVRLPDAVPPQSEPRVVSPAVYDGEPGGPCVCAEPGDCRRHPAIQKAGRLYEICRGEVLTPEKCAAYRLAWDKQHELEQVIEPAVQVADNSHPADCVHRGEFLRTCESGG